MTPTKTNPALAGASNRGAGIKHFKPKHTDKAANNEAMTAETVIRNAAVEGVRLTLSPPDKIKIIGRETAVDRWMPVIQRIKPAIVAALKQASNIDAEPELFEFSPPSVTADSHLISFDGLCRSAIDHRRYSTNYGQ